MFVLARTVAVLDRSTGMNSVRELVATSGVYTSGHCRLLSDLSMQCLMMSLAVMFSCVAFCLTASCISGVSRSDVITNASNDLSNLIYPLYYR